ncbi:MAG: serine hydrolase [Gemmatimonadaceae bacterium]|nr:serine hydrolase [Gemmatimonadaceae bacterium]
MLVELVTSFVLASPAHALAPGRIAVPSLVAPADAVARLASFGDGLPSRRAAEVEMDELRLSTITRVVNSGVSAGGFPGAAVVVGRRGASVYERGFGRLGWGEDSPYVDPKRSVYDLASLTKVVATTSAIMILYDEGKLRLDDHVSKYVPGFSGGWKDLVTIQDLLVHRSGLPAGRDLWRFAWTPDDARRMVIETPLVAYPGERTIYSDLGADMLGFVAESITGEKLDRFIDRRVFQPLGMTETWFRVPSSVRGRTAPTATTSIRGYSLQGEVHDENAFALGQVAGHAGLFSTAADLSVFAQMMLNRGTYNGVRIVSDTTVARFTARTAGSRALGWDTCAGHGGCGRYLSSAAYGHTGFTGTSMWIDPQRQLFVVLLSNRVYASRARRPERVISDVRADLADAAAWAVRAPGLEVATDYEPDFRADQASGWNPEVVREVATVRSRSAGCVSRGRALARKSARGRKSARAVSRCGGTSSRAVKASRAGKGGKGRASSAAVKSRSAKGRAGKASARKAVSSKAAKGGRKGAAKKRR